MSAPASRAIRGRHVQYRAPRYRPSSGTTSRLAVSFPDRLPGQPGKERSAGRWHVRGMSVWFESRGGGPRGLVVRCTASPGEGRLRRGKLGPRVFVSLGTDDGFIRDEELMGKLARSAKQAVTEDPCAVLGLVDLAHQPVRKSTRLNSSR